MYFEFPCAKCERKLKVSEEHRGRKIRCPYCHQAQQVPAPQAVEGDPLEFLAQQAPAPARPGSGGAAASARGAKGSSRPVVVPPADAAADEPSSAAGPAAGGPTADPSVPARRASSRGGTDVSPVQSGLIGLGVFVAVYAALYPLQSWYLGALLWNRGWVQFAEVFLAAWAGAILAIKARRLAVQRDSMLFDLLPTEIAEEISPATVEAFTGHIRALPVQAADSFLVNRVLRGLEHFNVLRNSGEVAGRLATQSEIDSNAVSASYTLVKVFVWAIPILGFIGTVLGIGQAVGSFSATMSAAGDLGALKNSFNDVTAGLSTAFDTTLLALVLSIFVMFPMTSLQKSEQALLNWVDEYCNENLLKRLKGVEAGPPPEATDRSALQEAIDKALLPHHVELAAWGKRFAAVGEKLHHQAAEGWIAIDRKIQAQFGESMRELGRSVESYQQITEKLRAKSEEQAKAMVALVQQGKEVQERVAVSVEESSQAMRAAGESIQRYFGALQQGLESLNRVLSGLGQQQVVIQQAPRRGLLSFFSRSDGGAHGEA